jgi:hypothetical protein
MNGILKTILTGIICSALGFAGCLPPEPAAKNPPAQQPVAAQEPAEMETVKAGVGVGQKGRSLDEYKGKTEAIIAQPAISFFAAKEKIAFEIQVPQAIAIFQATEGRFPKDHDEFMERIVKENNIPLPVLPQGHEYKYDPESHQLMVVRPKASVPQP